MSNSKKAVDFLGDEDITLQILEEQINEGREKNRLKSRVLKSIFDAYCEAGFDERQALYLTSRELKDV